MKVIGLIGGLSWESTSLYYKHINTLTLNMIKMQSLFYIAWTLVK